MMVWSYQSFLEVQSSRQLWAGTIFHEGLEEGWAHIAIVAWEIQQQTTRNTMTYNDQLIHVNQRAIIRAWRPVSGWRAAFDYSRRFFRKIEILHNTFYRTAVYVSGCPSLWELRLTSNPTQVRSRIWRDKLIRTILSPEEEVMLPACPIKLY